MTQAGKDTRRKVGIIGAAPDRGWASMAHIPALQALPGYEVAAICTRNMASARAVADQFDIPLAFDDPAALAAHPDIDFITVTVKASAHHDVLTAVLPQGKPVLCEWPVGKSEAETRVLAAAAATHGVRTFTGLQSRHIPAFRYVHDLIAAGEIGRLLSINLLTTAAVWGPVVHSGDAYTTDERHGATLLNIWGGHTLDMVWNCFGDFAEASVLSARQRPSTRVMDTGETLRLDTPDNIMINARLANDAVANIHLRGGPLPGTSFRVEAVGEKGMLSVEGDGIFAMVIGALRVGIARAGDMALSPLAIPADYYCVDPATLSPAALNVAEMYAAIGAALDHGADGTVSFDAAARRRERLAALAQAAASGKREPVPQG